MTTQPTGPPEHEGGHENPDFTPKPDLDPADIEDPDDDEDLDSR